jgi:hypothetical protein
VNRIWGEPVNILIELKFAEAIDKLGTALTCSHYGPKCIDSGKIELLKTHLKTPDWVMARLGWPPAGCRAWGSLEDLIPRWEKNPLHFRKKFAAKLPVNKILRIVEIWKE